MEDDNVHPRISLPGWMADEISNLNKMYFKCVGERDVCLGIAAKRFIKVHFTLTPQILYPYFLRLARKWEIFCMLHQCSCFLFIENELFSSPFFAVCTKGRRYHVLHFKTRKQLEIFILRLQAFHFLPTNAQSSRQKRSEEKEFDFAITFKLKILPFAERPFNLESLHLSSAIIWS